MLRPCTEHGELVRRLCPDGVQSGPGAPGGGEGGPTAAFDWRGLRRQMSLSASEGPGSWGPAGLSQLGDSVPWGRPA
ncbi:hypothetical protein MRX96_041461 [Rhipicephalus microplus]